MAGGKIDILIEPELNGFASKLEGGLRGGLMTAGKIGAGIGAALGGAATVKAVAEIGVSFDKQMNTMAAVSQATGGELAAVEQHARELGRSADLTATSASDAAAAMTELVKGGFSVQESMDAAKGTLQLASAAQIDAASAATIQSQALQAFGLDASYAATASDVLAGAANASSAEIEGIAQGLQQSGSVAHQFGLSLEDNATALAMFANAGIQGSDAGTLLKSALLALTDQGKPAQQAIDELGLSVYDAQGKFVGMESLFGQLSDAQARMTDEQYQAATATLFGSDAMRLAGVAAEQGAEGWRTTYTAVTRAGQASEVAAAQAKGIPGILEAIQNQAEDSGIAIYKAFSGLAIDGGGAIIGMLQDVGPKVEAAATGMATGIERALPTVQRVAEVAVTGVGQIADSLGVIGGAGVGVITDLAGVLQPAASGALNLSENLGSLTGPLMAATAALAIGKWQGWGDALTATAAKFADLKSQMDATRGLMGNVSQDIDRGDGAFAQLGQDVTRAGAAFEILGEKYPVIAKMGDAYRSASAPMKEFAAGQRFLAAEANRAASETNELSTVAGHLSTVMYRDASAGVASFAGTLRGGLAAGATAAKSAVGGIVGALGGPWNLALAGAAFAVAGITNEIAKSRESAKILADLGTQARATGDDLYNAFNARDIGAQIAATTTGMEKLMASYEQLAETGPGAFAVFTGAWADWKDALSGGDGRAGTDAYLAQKETAQNAKQVSEALREAGITAEAAGAAVGGSAAQYNELVGQLDTTTEGGRAAANVLREQRAAYLEMQEITAALAPGSVELSQALATIGDEAASSEDKVSALSSALDNMLGIDPTADEALAGLHEEIDQVTESATQALDQSKGWADSLFNADGGLDLAQENARTLRETLMGMRESLVDVGLAGEDVDAAFAAQQPALDALAAQYGLTGEQVRTLANEMGLVPPLVEATIAVSNSEALAGLEEVYGAIQKGQIEAGKPVPLQVANVDESIAKLEELGFAVEDVHRLEDGSGSITVTAETQDAIDDINTLVAATAAVESEKGLVITSNAPDEIEKMRSLGAEITDLGDGQYRIDSNTPEQIQSMIDLGILVTDPLTGEVILDGQSINNADSNMNNLRGNVQAGAQGQATMSSNATLVAAEIDRLLQGKKTYGTHYQTTLIATTYANSAGGTQPVSGHMQADGSVRKAADGLLSAQPAQIAPGGSWLLWGEDETQGESFIPHAPAKRRRSTQILAETAGIFGLSLIDAVGAPVRRDGTSVEQTGQMFADGAVRTAGEIDDFARGLEGAPYVWGGVNWGDCSGAMSAIARFATGLAPFAGRFATGSEAAALAGMGFQPGMGPAGSLRFGWYNGGPGGGHTAGTLPSGVNVEMGGARGNGQYGGPAAGANHPQFSEHAWIPADGTGSPASEGSDYSGGAAEGKLPLKSSSTKGVQLLSGGKVDFGSANKFYDLALKSLKTPVGRGVVGGGFPSNVSGLMDRFRQAVPLFDTGGVMAHGTYGRNESGANELVLTNYQWAKMAEVVSTLPPTVEGMQQAAAMFKDAAEAGVQSAEARSWAGGSTLGGEFIGSTILVRDAEKGLADTRKSVATEVENIERQEYNLALAREDLAKTTSENAVLSTSTQRQLEDAERKLNEARADGKPDKVADAERKLAREREDAQKELAESTDDNAEATRSAMEKVQTEERKLAELREENADASDRLEAAERAIISARLQSIGDIVGGVSGALDMGFTHITGFFDQMARAAKTVDDLRQSISKLQMEQVTNAIQLQKATFDVQLSEWDLQRTRARGVMSVAEAEWDLEQARDHAALMGLTSIEAMSGAMDRFYESGIFTVGEVAKSVVDQAAAVRDAEWGVFVARAQANANEHAAIVERTMRQYDLAKATLTQNAAVEMLRLQTDQLAKQTASLYGMTANQATGAAVGFGGIQKVVGGIGKSAGGALSGAALGMALGGPAGAAIGGLLGLFGGLGDIVKGASDIHNNKDEMSTAWEGMDGGQKAGVVLGGIAGTVLAAGSGVAGAYYGQEAGSLVNSAGQAITDATLGGMAYDIGSKLDANARRYADQTKALELNIESQKLALEAARLKYETQAAARTDSLLSEVEYGKLQQLLARANTEDQARAIAAAAELEAERMGHMLTVSDSQLNELQTVNGRLADLVKVTRDNAAAQGTGIAEVSVTLPPGDAFTRHQVEDLVSQVISGLDMRLRDLEQSGNQADDYYLARTI